jgi:hypothetical protein
MFCNAQAATKESNDGDGSMRHEHGPVVDGEANNEMKPNGKVTTAAAAAMPAAMQPKSNEIFSSAADLVTNTKADDASELEAKEQYVAKADCPSTLRNAEQTNSPVLLSVSLPSESQPGTAMISPPTPLILRDDAVKDSTSYIPFSSGTPASRDDVGLYHLMNAACRKSAAAAPLHDDTSQLLSSDEMGKSMPMSTSNEEPGTKKPTASEISANQSLQVINQGSPAMNESSQTKADSASDPSKLAYQLSYEPTTSTTNPTLQSLSSFIPSNSSHERRGSGFLLMAAEAMERTESREKAIRHAAMQIAAASSETVDNAAAAAAHTMSSPSDYSARLQQVFEMPSLRADQLSTTSTRDYTQQQQQPIAWSMTAPLVEPKKSPPKSIAKPKSYDTDLLPSGRPRPPPQKHVYHDYASVYDPSMDADGNSQSRKKTGGVTQPFPDKLMAMLDQETIDHPEVVSWLPHGRAFLVRKPKVFTTDIMPIYFRQSKLTSFQRQLNLCKFVSYVVLHHSIGMLSLFLIHTMLDGFRRITQGADGGAYVSYILLQISNF